MPQLPAVHKIINQSGRLFPKKKLTAQFILARMAGKRAKKPHRCKNHPRIVARGRCAACGKWVCATCAVLQRGLYRCRDTCAVSSAHGASPAAPVAEPSRMQTGTPETHDRPRAEGSRSATVTLLAGIALGLCGIAFGLFQFTQNRSLQGENAKLQENRAQLLGLVRDKNARIAELTGTTVPAEETVPDVTSAKGPTGRRAPLRPIAPGPSYSFNNGARDKKLVALTFDGGAHANATIEILDTLRSRGVKGTMFVTGGYIRRHGDIVRRMVAEGHDVGNHLYSHPRLTTWADTRTHTTLPGVSETMIADELRRTEEVFGKVTGRRLLPVWRAPYGEVNRAICEWARAHGYLHVGWGQGRTWRENLDTNDWIPDEHTPGYHTPEEVLRKILERADTPPYGINGGIILLHLGTVRNDPDERVHTILGRMIESLAQRGYRMVPIREMLRESGVTLPEA